MYCTESNSIHVGIIRTVGMTLVLLFGHNLSVAQQSSEIIGDSWLHFTDAPNALYHHVSSQAFKMLGQRDSVIAGINSLDGWKERQQRVRNKLLEIAGPFPEKTPLNAKIIRKIKKDGYTIEHIIYQSRPGLNVTSSLFIPDLKKKAKAPAVIYCSGHSEVGYRGPVYLHVIVNLVKKGFVVFAFDPLGQGERLEYFNPATGKSDVGGPTREHSYPGTQGFVVGNSQASYMVWDGIRAIDYLLTRSEVDPARIGITGRSGGGTQAAYIAAIDDRIHAAAPENYITNFTRLLQTIGSQDAEQNLPGEISSGIDHGDFLIVRAPKPAMMITTTRDMFSIQGAMETEKEVHRIYEAYGAHDKFSRVEDDTTHASTTKNREAMYAFFQRHLNNEGSPTDQKWPLPDSQEMRVTSTGQIHTSHGGETIYSLNHNEAKKLHAKLQASRVDLTRHLPGVINDAMELSGYIEPHDESTTVFVARQRMEGFTMEKYWKKGEGDYVIPFLLLRPGRPNNIGLIYLDPQGKSMEGAVGNEVTWFARNGYTVLVPDLLGIGEMGPGDFRGDAYMDGTSHNIWYETILIGRSIVGIHAGDIVRLVRTLKKDFYANEVIGFARQTMVPGLLHAAAFEQSLTRIVLVDAYSSYQSVALNRFYDASFSGSLVSGALGSYDLPDLAAVLAPRKLLMVGVTDGAGEYAREEINDDLQFIRDAYASRDATGQLKITMERSAALHDDLASWLKQE